MNTIVATVLESAPLAEDLHLLVLSVPEEAAAQASPGQFAHIQVPDDAGHLLRRPISIYSMRDGKLHLAIQPKKQGTKRITAAKAGDALNILFPLGKGFHLEEGKEAWLVGGGVGVAPLRYAAEAFGDKASNAFLGYRTAGHVYGREDFQKAGCQVHLCTDDGSAGLHGLVTAPLADMLKEHTPDVLMACGPAPMLRAVKAIGEEHGIPTQLSLEQRMGCGFGACLTCSCKASWDGYLRACADGPVFDGKAVSL